MTAAAKSAAPLFTALLLGCGATGHGRGDEPASQEQHVFVSHSIAKPGRKDALLATTMRVVAGTENADGLLQYQLYSAIGDDAPVMLLSIWESQEQERAFMASEAGQRLHGPELESEMESMVDQSWLVDSALEDSWQSAEGEPLVQGLYALAIHAIAKPSAKSELVEAVAAANRASQAAEGLLQYIIFSTDDDDGPITSISIWAAARSHETFMRSDAAKEMQSTGITKRMDELIDRSWTVDSELIASWLRGRE